MTLFGESSIDFMTEGSISKSPKRQLDYDEKEVISNLKSHKHWVLDQMKKLAKGELAHKFKFSKLTHLPVNFIE